MVSLPERECFLHREQVISWSRNTPSASAQHALGHRLSHVWCQWEVEKEGSFTDKSASLGRHYQGKGLISVVLSFGSFR